MLVVLNVTNTVVLALMQQRTIYPWHAKKQNNFIFLPQCKHDLILCLIHSLRTTGKKDADPWKNAPSGHKLLHGKLMLNEMLNWDRTFLILMIEINCYGQGGS